ncbi:hypothetical protein [Clostridium botulinum]|uniref:hypothetical protein n=1 Tax=Clostridium botulinum TaxID=1491 RepID=UPI001C9B4344|nr:hypothetical protein [Clostridium botulinum]MBY6842629.1 hypothetical protein [Clostridium botulinum]
MAKEIQLNKLKKGASTFNLIGETKIKDFTFKLDVESTKTDSDWVYNQMNLGIDCGDEGIIYADMMGGYGTERQNQVYVHGTKEDENKRKQDDFNAKFTIDWEDRFDEEILKTVGDMCFITVGVEKDENGKTVYKKFLSEYDAIQYISENLKDETVVNIKGNLVYSLYNDTVQVQKKITSICLSKAEKDQFKATFTQMLLLDKDSVGKVDKETLTIPIYAKVLDYVKEFDKKIVKATLPLAKTFNIKVTKEDVDKVKKLLKFFKAKPKTITSLVVDGVFSRGEVNTTEVTEDDIPNDIKDLIELGYVDKEEVLNKIALANGGGNKPEEMIITSPHIKMVGDEVKTPRIERNAEAYTEDDLNIALILQTLNIEEKSEDVSTEEDIDKDDVIDKAIEEIEDGSDGSDDNWLENL